MDINFKDYLQNDILPFWMKNAIDYENGGIYNYIDREGNIYGKEKNVWFTGRAMWTFAKAYNFIEKKEEYLKIAKHMYEFLPKCTDTDSRMFFIATADGKELLKRDYYYSETFAAAGCAELYKATADEEVMKKAEFYFNTAYDLYKNPAYYELEYNSKNAPFKSLAPSMIMLNTALIMLSTGKSTDRYKKITEECANEIIHGGYLNYELGVLLERVTVDGKFYDSPYTREVNPGHSLECAWFLLSAGLVLENDEFLKAGRDIIDLMLECGVDKEHGGIIAFADALGKPSTYLEWNMKIWWPQCEAIIATALAYNIFNDEKYQVKHKELLDYAFKYYPDKEFGEWYGYLNYDNTLANTLKGNISKGPFHLPRMIMILSALQTDGNIKRFLK